MSSVRDYLSFKISAARTELARLETMLASIPAELHSVEVGLLTRLHDAFFPDSPVKPLRTTQEASPTPNEAFPYPPPAAPAVDPQKLPDAASSKVLMTIGQPFDATVKS